MATRVLNQNVVVNDPPFAAALFSSTKMSILWLIIRLYVGYEWITAGLEKASNPAWTVTGAALKGFWVSATAAPKAGGHPAVAFDWYRAFLTGMLNSGSYVWFSKLVVAGEILIGIALILGLFTGIAAFFGGFMNWNFMMAGSASVNPVLFVLAIILVLAWKTAGWIGLDHFVLPLVGTPWQAGQAFKKTA